MSGKERVIRNYNPPSAVDLIIEMYHDKIFEGIVLIERGNPPFKGRKALPGGFQEMGDSLEKTALKEAKEETGLDVMLVQQLKVYSEAGRDPRGPVNSVGYVCRAKGVPQAGDDAAHAQIYRLADVPHPLAFDHSKRIEEYAQWVRDGRRGNIDS